MLLTDARSSVPRPFHLMAKPTGAVCNPDCEYVRKDADAVTDWYASHRPEIPLEAAPPSGGAP